MVLCRDEEKAEQIETLALHGLSAGAWARYSATEIINYGVVAPGFKYNMTDLQAAIGMHQITRLESWRKRREDIWARYDETFRKTPLGTPADIRAGDVHARHLYTLSIDEKAVGFERDWFREALHAEGIGTGVHFIPVHQHPFYARELLIPASGFPNSERAGATTVSLPLSPSLTDEDVETVTTAVMKVLASRDG